MMFTMHIAFALEVLALLASTAFLVWACKEETACKGFAKGVAYFGLVVAIFGMLCTGYYAVRYWEDGHFRTPHLMFEGSGSMMGPGQMGGREMMMQKMMDCPMMKKERGKPQKPQNPANPAPPSGSSAEEHEEHHE